MFVLYLYNLYSFFSTINTRFWSCHYPRIFFSSSYTGICLSIFLFTCQLRRRYRKILSFDSKRNIYIFNTHLLVSFFFKWIKDFFQGNSCILKKTFSLRQATLIANIIFSIFRFFFLCIYNRVTKQTCILYRVFVVDWRQPSWIATASSRPPYHVLIIVAMMESS